jgi:hypothetical protein
VPPPADEAAKFNVARGCQAGSQQYEEFVNDGKRYVTLAAKEQYCNTSQYFTRHPRCVAQLRHFFDADLRLLGGGETPGDSDGPAANQRRLDWG